MDLQSQIDQLEKEIVDYFADASHDVIRICEFAFVPLRTARECMSTPWNDPDYGKECVGLFLTAARVEFEKLKAQLDRYGGPANVRIIGK